MKKLLIILLFALMIAVLSSCADAVVSYQITDDNDVIIDYSLLLFPGEESVSTYINAITKYWSDMGFTAGSTEENGTYKLNGTKIINCDTRSAAAAQLSSILTDKNSFFYDAEFNYSPSYFEDNYSFYASVSLKDIIRKNEEHTIPASEVDTLILSAEQGEYTLRISLPGEIVETNADVCEGNVCEWELAYGETRRIELSSKKAFEENIEYYANLQDTRERDNILLLASAAAAGVVLLIIIILLIVRRSRSKKAEALKIRVKRF